MYSYTFQIFLLHVQHFSHIAPLFLDNVTSLLLLCDSKRILSSLGIHNTKLLPCQSAAAFLMLEETHHLQSRESGSTII